MGSYLYQRGVFLNRSYDELVLSQPELIQSVHQQYIDAGANVIETNSFGANRLALAKHGHSDRCVEINHRAAEIARQAAGDEAFVAGAVGPTGTKFSVASVSQRRMARVAIQEQIASLAEGGVDILCLETFSSILELELALDICQQVAPSIPVVAMLVFDDEGLSEGGLKPPEVADRLIAAGADIIGANCGTGPPELYHVGKQMIGRGAPVAVMPNAGMPSVVEGRTIYVANPEHFGVFARRMLKSGVRIIGGCCGTTPEHTRAMLGAVRMMGINRPTKVAQPSSVEIIRDSESPPPPAIVPFAQRSRLGARLAAGEFAISVELTPPTGTDLEPFVGKVRRLMERGCLRQSSARDWSRADPARVLPGPQLPWPVLAPTRLPRTWHPQPGDHHRRPPKNGRLSFRNASLRRRLHWHAPTCRWSQRWQRPRWQGPQRSHVFRAGHRR
jgi:homocysteine S-methyltransferase